MYCPVPIEYDDLVFDPFAAAGEWFNVEGDLDDFIFFDPSGLSPEPSSK